MGAPLSYNMQRSVLFDHPSTNIYQLLKYGIRFIHTLLTLSIATETPVSGSSYSVYNGHLNIYQVTTILGVGMRWDKMRWWAHRIETSEGVR